MPLVVTSTVSSSHVGTSATPDLREKDPRHEVPQRKHNLAGRNETSTEATAITETEGAVRKETVTDAVFKTYTQHVNVSVIMTTHNGTVSPPGNQDELACTVYMPLSGSLLEVIIDTEIMVNISSIIL